MSPQPQPRTCPPPPAASLLTPNNPGALGLRRTIPGAPRERGHRRESTDRPSWRLAERVKERRARRKGGRRPGPRGWRPGGGRREWAARRCAFSCKAAAGRGARPGGGACHRSAFSLFAFLRVFSAWDQTSEQLRAWPSRGRRGEGGAAASRGPPCARASRRLWSRRRALPREAKVCGGGPELQPAPGRAPRAPGLRSLPGIVRKLCSSPPRLHLGGGRARRAGPGAAVGGGGALCAPLGLGWAGMGGGPSGDEEPGPAARARERRL